MFGIFAHQRWLSDQCRRRGLLDRLIRLLAIASRVLSQTNGVHHQWGGCCVPASEQPGTKARTFTARQVTPSRLILYEKSHHLFPDFRSKCAPLQPKLGGEGELSACWCAERSCRPLGIGKSQKQYQALHPLLARKVQPCVLSRSKCFTAQQQCLFIHRSTASIACFLSP
jgi:hypothetical protein